MKSIIYNQTLNLFYGSASGSNGKWFQLLHSGVKFIDNSKELKIILHRNDDFKLISILSRKIMGLDVYLSMDTGFNLDLIVDHCNIYGYQIEKMHNSTSQKQHILISHYVK